MSDHRDPTPDEFARVASRYIEPKEADDRPTEDDGLRIERSVPPADNLVQLTVRDSRGRIRGMLALELDAMEMDIPDRLLRQVRKGVEAPTRPDLRLVG